MQKPQERMNMNFITNIMKKKKTKEEIEDFKRHMKYVIQFFESPNMVKWEEDPKKRLKKWVKLSKTHNIGVPISDDEAKFIKKKINEKLKK